MKRIYVGRLIIFSLIVGLLLITAACDSVKAEDIEGTWIVNGGTQDDGTMVLDGSGNFTMKDSDGTLRGTYELTSGSITFTVKSIEEKSTEDLTLKEGDSIVCGLTLDGDSLTINNDGALILYTRK